MSDSGGLRRLWLHDESRVEGLQQTSILFPPEALVESRYLKQKMEQLKQLYYPAPEQL